ncbi:MAG TPA: extracellular solute-binding protein [Candidatus Methylomirabilis sp.]|nr:extracellular solute-binding protein [Candidatus Methylomirabilis sp.]
MGRAARIGTIAGVILGLAVGLATAGTKEVIVVTSFPKELFENYKKAFEAKHPGVTVVINAKQTNAGVTYLQETKAKPAADIFWVSAPDAFLTLKSDGILEKYTPPKEIVARIPARIGAFPISDPDGTYFGFAVSGYGLMWNKPYMQTHKLPEPKEWTDLADPRYHGHLVISAPSRSGTTHLTIEVILQAYGWEKGWALLLNTGGNMGSITERSFGVPEAVNSGQYGIGVVIDFFGLSAIASGFPVDFVYPSLTSVVPASVGMVKGGPNPENARAFVSFLLGDEGQMLLFSKEIGRLPVVPDLYAKAPVGYPNPFTMKLGGVDFNNKLSSGRRNVVNSLFDHIITFRHAELKAAWAAIYRAEEAIAKVSGKDVTPAKTMVAEARKLATGVPVDAKKAGDKEVNAAFKDKDKAEVKSRLETEWDTFAKANYGKAKELAEKAAAALR